MPPHNIDERAPQFSTNPRCTATPACRCGPSHGLKNAGEAARIGKDGLTDYGKRRVRGLVASIARR